MRIVGVIDLMGGVVVHALAGQRHTYRPLVSQLGCGTDPEEVAWAFVGLGLVELYVADLDAIAGATPAWEILDRLHLPGVCLWVDVGVQDVARGVDLARHGIDRVVVGLESVPNVGTLAALVERLSDRVVFSLDLHAGRPLGSWESHDPWEIARLAVEVGVERILVLDLAQVGGGRGPKTAGLCARLAEAYPRVEISAGGGVQDKSDLELMRSSGVQALLVASALHTGRLERGDLIGNP